MPLTILDPNTALIVIDLQKGIVNGNFIHPIWEVIDRTRALNRCFPCEAPPSRAGQCGGTEQPSDIAVTKRSWGAFATTDLERQLRARGVTQVVVTGVVTSGGVEATARQAYEQGFNVTLALDAMTDIREEAHEYSIRNVFARLGETGSTQEIISLLERRSSAS